MSASVTTWLDRAATDATLDRFVAAVPAPGSGMRLLVVDGPPGHGAGTVLGDVPRRTVAAGHRSLAAGVREPDRSVLPELAAALDVEGADDRTVGRTLAAVARRHPTVVAVDDVQRLGDAERARLHDVLARVRHLPVRVVLRSWGGAPGDGALDPGRTAVLTLGPLAAPVVRACLDAHGVAAPDGFADDLVAATGGTPGVVAAALRAVLRGAPAALGAPALDGTLSAARREQDARVLHALPAPAARLALVLGLAGELPSTGALAVVAGVDPLRAGEGLRYLRAGGLLGAGDEPVLRDVGLARRVLAGVDRAVRSELAGHAADRARCGGLPDEVVGRLLAAVTGPLPAWSAGVLRRAGQREAARGRCPRVGAAHLGRARLVPGLTAEEEGLLGLDEAAGLAAANPELAERRLTELVLRSTVPAVRVRAADQLVARRTDRASREVVARALSRRGIEEGERAALHALYWTVRHHDEAPEGVREPRVEPLPDFPADPETAGVSALATARRGGARSLPRVRALARLALADGEGRTAASRIAACRALVLTEDLAAARAGLTALLAEPAVRGSRVLRAAVRLARVEEELRGGRLAAARSTLWSTLRELPARCWPAETRGRLIALSAQIALMRGEHDHAARWLARGSPGAERDPWTWLRMRFVRGAHGLATGEWATAGHQLLHCGRALAGVGSPNPAVLPWRSLAAITLHLRGEVAAACTLAEKEVELARAWASPGALGWSLAVLGTVDPAPGTSLLTEGVAMLRRSELRHELAIATTLLAGAEPDPELAHAAARSAVQLFEESGALRGADDLRRLIPAGAGAGGA